MVGGRAVARPYNRTPFSPNKADALMKIKKIAWESAHPPLTPCPLSHASGERGKTRCDALAVHP